MSQVYFNNIAQIIKKQLESAEHTIKIAVAWFTNDRLFHPLLDSLKKGLTVELVIIDDAINRNELALDFPEFIKFGGKLFFSSTKKMHNKFCIIDENILMTGSYNWTLYAEALNWENLLLSDDKSIIKEYCEEFQRIVSDSKEISIYEPILLHELKETDLFNNYEYLCNDLSLKGQRYKNAISAINNESKREVTLDERIPSEFDRRGIPLLKKEWNAKTCKKRLVNFQIKTVPSFKPSAGKKYILAYLTFSESMCRDEWVHIIDDEYVLEMMQYFYEKDGGLVPNSDPLPDIPEDLYTPNRKYRFQLKRCYFQNDVPHYHLDSNGELFRNGNNVSEYKEFSLLMRLGNGYRDYIGFDSLTEAYSWTISNLFLQGSIDEIDKEFSFSYNPSLSGIYQGKIDDLFAIRLAERNLNLKQDSRQKIFSTIEKRLKYNPEGYWLEWNHEVISYIYGIYSYNHIFINSDFAYSEKSDRNGVWFKIINFHIADYNKNTGMLKYNPLLKHVISKIKDKVKGIIAYAFNIDKSPGSLYDALIQNGFVEDGFLSKDICVSRQIRYGEIIQMKLIF